MAEDERLLAVFASVHFQIILSDRLTATTAEELSLILEKYGGIAHRSPSKAGTRDLDGLTHIITETIDFDGCVPAEDRMIAIVNPSWIANSVSKKRLANPKSHSPDPRMFFSGLVVCTAGLLEGDKDAIIGGVLAMGGLYSGSISKLVTHVVALDMEPVPCQTVISKGFKCKIVRPEWFDDCLRLGKRINEAPYLLSDPLTAKDVTNVPPGVQTELQGAISPSITGIPSSTPGLRRDAILHGKKFVLAGDLAINEHLRDSIIAVIIEAGGTVCDVAEDCDVFVGHFRSGHGYNEAYRLGKVIGNLPWLYWMVAHNRWTSPLQRLLHYPIPQDGLPGTKSFRLCLSNYSGESRIYLESLAKAAGCEFTKTLKNDNTHLITAHTQSEKCDAAREWGINLVNHLWLEESYARCQVQSPRNPRYVHFPPHTNLTEVVGQTPIDREALNLQFHGHIPDPPSSSANSALADTSIAAGSPSKPLTQRTRAVQVEKNRKETPSTKQMAGKENEIPSFATSGRSAKTKATERLHAFGEDMLLYEKERKRVGGVLYGGRKPDTERTERKRSMSDANLTGDEKETPNKKGRPAMVPLKMRILVTGVPEYSGNDKKSIRIRDQLRSLGILVTESEYNCKYLVAPRILRTRKFLCAIAQAPTVINPSFLNACLEQNEILDYEDFAVADTVGEERYGVNLQEAQVRAVKNRGRMLHGWTIWVTAHIENGHEPYVAIVEANGGKCLPFQGRPGSIPHGAQSSDSEADETNPDTAYLISGPSPTEEACWAKFRQMASEAGREPRIVQREWLLDAALRQEVRWNPEYVQRGEIGEDLD